MHFFKYGASKGIEFDADHTTKGVIEWVQNQTAKKFKFDTDALGEDPKPEEDEKEAGEDDEECDYEDLEEDNDTEND